MRKILSYALKMRQDYLSTCYLDHLDHLDYLDYLDHLGYYKSTNFGGYKIWRFSK